MAERYWRVTDPDCVLRPGVDQVRFRTYNEHASRWGDWTDWHTIGTAWTIGDFTARAGEPSLTQEWQFRRPLHMEAATQADDEFEPLPIDNNMITQPGRDQARYRCYRGTWSQWFDIEGKPAAVVAYITEMPSHYEWEFRRRKQAPAASHPQPSEPEQPVLSAGSKYKRMIRQTLPEGHPGTFVVCDVYDVLRAWDVTCPAIQHALKKLLQPGQRGSKSAVQDLREAIGSIERAIQLLGDEQ